MQETTAPAIIAGMKAECTDRANNDLGSVQKFMCEYIIPDEKAEALIKYITDMRLKNPKMSNDRIFRKSAEFFKLKKVITN